MMHAERVSPVRSIVKKAALCCFACVFFMSGFISSTRIAREGKSRFVFVNDTLVVTVFPANMRSGVCSVSANCFSVFREIMLETTIAESITARSAYSVLLPVRTAASDTGNTNARYAHPARVRPNKIRMGKFFTSLAAKISNFRPSVSVALRTAYSGISMLRSISARIAPASSLRLL